jgi:hypothetical protein
MRKSLCQTGNSYTRKSVSRQNLLLPPYYKFANFPKSIWKKSIFILAYNAMCFRVNKRACHRSPWAQKKPYNTRRLTHSAASPSASLPTNSPPFPPTQRSPPRAAPMASPAKRARPSSPPKSPCPPPQPLQDAPAEDPRALLRRRWELASVLHFLQVSPRFRLAA